jgi:hypothetical protein
MTDSSQGEIDALVTGYVRFAGALALGVPSDTAELAIAERAYESVGNTVRGGPAALAWELVVRILRSATDERLEMYAASLLEDLVRLRGTEVIAQIEHEAATDQRFQWALGCIWLLVGEVPTELQERIVRASGGSVKPLDAGPLAAALRRLPPNER